MQPIFAALLTLVTTLFRSRLALQLEIVALRHQLSVYQRSVKRPMLQPSDRLFWVWLSRLWSGWQQALAFVQPRTVLAWQKQRFRHVLAPAQSARQAGAPWPSRKSPAN